MKKAIKTLTFTLSFNYFIILKFCILWQSYIFLTLFHWHVLFWSSLHQNCFISFSALSVFVIYFYMSIISFNQSNRMVCVRKLEELKQKYRKMYWRMNRHSVLSVYNKLLIYQHVISPFCFIKKYDQSVFPKLAFK